MRCLVLAVVAIAICRAATLDFANAVIVIPPNATAPEKKAATMLSEEIEKRTQLRLKVQSQPASGAAFVIGRADQIRSLGAGSLAGRLTSLRVSRLHPHLPGLLSLSSQVLTIEVSSSELDTFCAACIWRVKSSNSMLLFMYRPHPRCLCVDTSSDIVRRQTPTTPGA